MYRLLFTVTVMLTLAGPAWSQTPTVAQVDFNGNGEVDFTDFLLFTEKFNTRQGDDEYEAKYDLDGNGAVNFEDFLIFVGFFGETVPAWELTEIAPAEGMPGELIELVGRFDVNTTYQVKFGTVLLPVFAQNAERITALVPVLESGSVSVCVVDAAGRESAPRSFEVLALPEPRMNAEQLQQTVAGVEEGIGNVLAPLTEAGVIYSEADAALFNREMAKLNAVWGVLGERIAALPPEDAALLVHLLDNSGALGILEGLGKIDLSASKVVAENGFALHYSLFVTDVVSALIGYSSELTWIASIVIGSVGLVTPVIPDLEGVASLIAAASITATVLKGVIDSSVPTDLQSLRVEIVPSPVPVDGSSGVKFFGEFKTESDFLTELDGAVGEGLKIAVKAFIEKKPGVKKALENEKVEDAVDKIVELISDIFLKVGFEQTGLNDLFSNVQIRRNDVPLNMLLYRLRFPSGPVTVVDGEEYVEYANETLSGKGKIDVDEAKAKLKVRAFRFVEPGGDSEGEPEGGNILVNIFKNTWEFVENINFFGYLWNSLEKLEIVVDFSVAKPFDAHFAGITYDNNKEFYIVHDNPDGNGGKVYKSKKVDGSWEHKELLDLTMVPFLVPNSSATLILLPTGIAYDDNNIYVVGWGREDDKNEMKVARYSMQHDDGWKQSGSVDLYANSNVTGVTILNNLFYVVDGDDDKVYVYMYHEKEDWWHNESKDFELDDANSNPSGITYANNLFYVVDAVDNKVYAYTSSGRRDSDADFKLDDANSDPSGITYANGKFYVVDYDGTIYDYDLDRAPLVDLYNATAGDNWTSNTDWLSDEPLENWQGVSTNEQGRVNRLILSANNLSGPIPEELGNLTKLTLLYLSRNQLSGSIPKELGDLTNLTRLSLYNNNLSGSIPKELGNLTKLTRLYLYENNLSGPIPKELGNLTKLTRLYLYENDLSGPIPEELGNLTKLDTLTLHNNRQLTGPIPVELGNLTNLTRLSLAGTGLCVPDEFPQGDVFNLIQEQQVPNCSTVAVEKDSLALVALYHATKGDSSWTNKTNWLSDKPLNEWYGVSTNAQGHVDTLDLRRNQLTGQIPSALGDLENLQTLTLHENQLTGTIPSALGELTNLTYLTLHNNRLSGPIPSALGKLTNLTIELNLSRNQLTGAIPVELGNLTNLTGLYLYDNQLTGSIPEALGKLTSLVELNLHTNQLEGPIPSALGNLTNLIRLDLHNNRLTGSIPEALDKLVNLKLLVLKDNSNLCLPVSLQTWANAIQSSDVQDLPICSSMITITDANLRAVISDSLGKARSEAITAAEMATLTRLDAPNRGISDLTGLEQATNLTWLNLGSASLNDEFVNSNAISDLSPLSNLTSLNVLGLDGNSISDISALSGLKNLNVLDLGGNNISDISALSGLTSLTGLGLSGNNSSDISALSDLTSLNVLSLDGNMISDISVLSGLTSLNVLSLSNNSVSDISVLSGLTSLSVLSLSGNNISDISALSGLTSLTYLVLYGNNISDLAPLVANIGLGPGDSVDVRRNPLSATSIHTHIPTLQGRGVSVFFGAFKPAVGEIERRRAVKFIAPAYVPLVQGHVDRGY